MATTYLQAVNSVLRRLREREVSSVGANSYATLVGVFINDAIKEVEGRWDWTGLRDTVLLETSPGTFRYQFQNVGTDAKLIYDSAGRPSVYNDTKDYFLRKAPSPRWMSARLNHSEVPQEDPLYFDVASVSNGEFIVDFYPIPDEAQTILFDMQVSHGFIDDDTTILKVPAQPVILNAWSKAVYERGEDQGYLSDLAHRDYERALADAIAMDMQNSSHDLTWTTI